MGCARALKNGTNLEAHATAITETRGVHGCYSALMAFKIVAAIVVGMLLGYTLGGIPARRELAALRSERDVLKARVENQARPNLLQALLPGFGALPGARSPGKSAAVLDRSPERVTASPANGSEGASRPPDARPAPAGDVAIIGAQPQPTLGSKTAGTAPAQAPTLQPEPPAGLPQRTPLANEPPVDEDRVGTTELLSGFGHLVTLQRVRSAAARAELVEKAGLTDAQVVRLDANVARMNAKLAGYGEEVIAQATSQEPPTPAQALGLGHDVSGILYDGQQELDALAGDGAKGVDPSAVEIWNYVDLGQWLPYVQKQLAQQKAGAPEQSSATKDGGADPAAAPTLN